LAWAGIMSALMLAAVRDDCSTQTLARVEAAQATAEAEAASIQARIRAIDRARAASDAHAFQDLNCEFGTQEAPCEESGEERVRAETSALAAWLGPEWANGPSPGETEGIWYQRGLAALERTKTDLARQLVDAVKHQRAQLIRQRNCAQLEYDRALRSLRRGWRNGR
jgi:hypothetical protein